MSNIFYTLNRLVLGLYTSAGIGPEEAVEVTRALAQQQIQIEGLEEHRNQLDAYTVQLAALVDSAGAALTSAEEDVTDLQENFDAAIERIDKLNAELNEVYRTAAEDVKAQSDVVDALRACVDSLLRPNITAPQRDYD